MGLHYSQLKGLQRHESPPTGLGNLTWTRAGLPKPPELLTGSAA